MVTSLLTYQSGARTYPQNTPNHEDSMMNQPRGAAFMEPSWNGWSNVRIDG